MKRQNGITLIALVITIIVLLILAGVSISMVIGNNGILNQASTARQNTTYSSEEEQVEVAYLSAKTKNLGGSVTVDNLNTALAENQVKATATIKDGTTDVILVTFTDTQNQYEVNGEIVTKVESPDSENTGVSLASQIDESNFGDYVNYPADLGIAIKGETLSDNTVPKTDWRIFYEDGSNVYLIASDYLPNNKYPSGVFGATYGSYNGYWLTDIEATKKLSTSGSITTNNSFLFTKLSNVTTTNYNYQAVSTLLDTSKWSAFAKTGYVDNVSTAVIGSPTVEMWMESWNDRYNDTLAYEANAKGYRVGLTADSLKTYISSSNMQAKEGWNNTLYYPHASTTSTWNSCKGYWLASPSAYDADDVMGVNYSGEVGYFHFSGMLDFGVRPVVSLKSGITATKGENGVWQLGE